MVVRENEKRKPFLKNVKKKLTPRMDFLFTTSRFLKKSHSWIFLFHNRIWNSKSLKVGGLKIIEIYDSFFFIQKININ